MINTIQAFINQNLNMNQELSVVVYYSSLTLVIALLAFLANLIGKKIILTSIKKLIKRTTTKKDEAFYERKVFHTLIYYLPLIVVYLGSFFYGVHGESIRKILLFITLLVSVTAVYRALDAFNDIYNQRAFAKSMPIKGLLQVVKIIILIFGAFVVVLGYNNTSTAAAILGSLGGMSAVILLIFRDSILGFVAGIQLSTNKLLRIGDWIEMPKYQADGEVIDVSLTKISVRNWDKTISHIPAYKFIEDSFVNWANMSQSGGRRIKRNILIDVNSIRFLTDEELKELKKITILEDYLKSKFNEITTYNKTNDKGNDVENRKLTNIGTFRAYIETYLRHHPKVKQDETLIVRQLEAEGGGLPLQVYCFTNDTRWAYYEGIQSDIFDHLYAVMDSFKLDVYQAPSGRDFQKIK